MCFKREGAISILSVKPQKLGDKLTYLSSNISSTESEVNEGVDCYRQVIDHMEILFIW